jgi:hypothetical protein
VARSYRELERDAVIETRGRAGTFIAASGDATQRQAQDARLPPPPASASPLTPPSTRSKLVRALLRLPAVWSSRRPCPPVIVSRLPAAVGDPVTQIDATAREVDA